MHPLTAASPFIKQPIASLLLIAALLSLASISVLNAQIGWRGYENPDVGYRLRYPAELFDEPKVDAAHNGLALTGSDGQARLFVFGGANELGSTSHELARDLSVMDDLHHVTYSRVISKWLVLSGYLADAQGGQGDIFYERVAISDDRRRLAGFRLEYPPTQRARFDHLIGQMGDSLALLPAGSLEPQAALARPPIGTEEPVVSASADRIRTHIEWCRAAYKTYDPQTDMFTRFDGIQTKCITPG
jgi:hypothetical protein